MPKFKLDDRKVKSIGWQDSNEMPQEYSSIEVGEDGVTHIDTFEQYLGEYSIIWFQVWKDESLYGRFNAKNIDSIMYFADKYTE